MIRVLIIGMGNIGKRHLQGLSNLQKEFEVCYYDKMKVTKDSVLKFCLENKIIIKNLNVLNTYKETLNWITDQTIIIVATTANGRHKLLKDIVLKVPKAILVEKPVCQTLKEYESIMDLSKSYSVPIYINFIAHLQDFYIQIRNELKDVKQFVFYSNMPMWGIACVGIHHFELLTWLLNFKKYQIVNTSESVKIYEQKRTGFYDVFGSVILRDANNNLCVINNSDFDSIASIQIITEEKIFTIYEQQKILTIINKRSPGKIDIKHLEYKYVSQYTHNIIESILSAKKSILPDIDEGFLSHKILFDYLKLNQLKKLNIT